MDLLKSAEITAADAVTWFGRRELLTEILTNMSERAFNYLVAEIQTANEKTSQCS